MNFPTLKPNLSNLPFPSHVPPYVFRGGVPELAKQAVEAARGVGAPIRGFFLNLAWKAALRYISGADFSSSDDLKDAVQVLAGLTGLAKRHVKGAQERMALETLDGYLDQLHAHLGEAA